MRFGPLKLKHCRYGWMLFTGPFIGTCFDLYGEYSEAEAAIMRDYIKSGDTVLDVGANIGDLTLPLAQSVGSEGRVYAIESHPDIFNILCGNLALNQCAQVVPMNVFIQHDENIPIRSEFIGSHRPHKILAIDDMQLEACRLIKIDVDGNELDVLKSGKKTIDQFRPILYLENDVREASQPLLEYLMKLEYEPYWHVAPIFSSNNFFGNPRNHWHPNGIISLMVLCLPKEQKLTRPDLKMIKLSTEWWDGRG